jgi:hypothetical protein
MPDEPLPIAVLRKVSLFFALLGAFAVILFAFPGKPRVQMYGIAAAAIAFMLWTTWSATARHKPKGQRLRFSLRTLLLWIVPYAAAVAWIVSWRGPHEQDFLNVNSKSGYLLILTQLWSGAFVVAHFVRRSRELRPARGASPSPTAGSPAATDATGR